jgi:hypothetical protein
VATKGALPSSSSRDLGEFDHLPEMLPTYSDLEETAGGGEAIG